jgi:hypothetical protein
MVVPGDSHLLAEEIRRNITIWELGTRSHGDSYPRCRPAVRAVGGGAGDGTAARRTLGLAWADVDCPGPADGPAGTASGRRSIATRPGANRRVGRGAADTGAAGEHLESAPQTTARRTVCRRLARDGATRAWSSRRHTAGSSSCTTQTACSTVCARRRTWPRQRPMEWCNSDR